MSPVPSLAKPLLVLLVGLAGLAAVDDTPLDPHPWEPTYPRDPTAELTAADWVGPDGIVYPLWTWSGVHIGEPGSRVRGIPAVTGPTHPIAAALAGPEQGEAFTAALAAAIDAAGEAGGGVVTIPAGTFHLLRPLLIRHDRVVIRGAGRGTAVEPGGRNDPVETRLRFDFAYGVDGRGRMAALAFPHHGRLTRDSVLGLYAQAFHPESSHRSRQSGGKRSHLHGFYLTIQPEGREPVTWAVSTDQKEGEAYDHWSPLHVSGPTNAASIEGTELAAVIGDAARVTIIGRVTWRWKEEEQQRETTEEGGRFVFDCRDFEETLPDFERNLPRGPITSALHFQGDERTLHGQRTWLSADAKRGDTVIQTPLESVEAAAAIGIQPGAAVSLFAYNSQSFADSIERDGNGGTNRRQHLSVLAVRPREGGGVDVEVEQPLQLTFPENEGQVDTWDPSINNYARRGTRSSWLAARLPIEECGVEDLVLEQMQVIWFNGISMGDCLNCWVRNVRIERSGRDPVHLSGSMWQISDCELIDPIYANNTGGGSAYLHGGDASLVENVYARNCRHAPNFAGGTAGVFRNSRFFSSDMQWHMGWGRCHLMENCVVDALSGTGSYGYAAFAQRNTADIHGPGMGPRNVIYRCDLIGPAGGIFLGGKSENPLVLHNRVRAWNGPGLILRYHVFNGVFLGNVFAVQNRFEPGVLFGDTDPQQSRLASGRDGKKPPIHPGLGGANPGNDFVLNAVYGGSGVIADGSWRFDHVRSEWRSAYGNELHDWDPNPPRPEPAMLSVYETQLAHPEGFADRLDPKRVIHQPDADQQGPMVKDLRQHGAVLVQVNFCPAGRPAANDPDHWHGQEPWQGWVGDQGEAFGDRGNGWSYGWVGGKPHVVREESVWSDEDIRYRTTAEWIDGDDLRPHADWDQQQDLRWRIALDPGTYRVFLAAGSPRKPERISWPDEQPLPFTQVNSYVINDVTVIDPGQSDVRRDAYWATVTVGEEGMLEIAPAAEAITPRLAFVQIYRAE